MLGIKNAFTITVWGPAVHSLTQSLFPLVYLAIFLQHFYSTAHSSYTGLIYFVFSVVVQGFLYPLLVFSL